MTAYKRELLASFQLLCFTFFSCFFLLFFCSTSCSFSALWFLVLFFFHILPLLFLFSTFFFMHYSVWSQPRKQTPKLSCDGGCLLRQHSSDLSARWNPRPKMLIVTGPWASLKMAFYGQCERPLLSLVTEAGTLLGSQRAWGISSGGSRRLQRSLSC